MTGVLAARAHHWRVHLLVFLNRYCRAIDDFRAALSLGAGMSDAPRRVGFRCARKLGASTARETGSR